MLYTDTRSGKDAVSKAALALFAERGIVATTTREIAKRAGVAEGTIYRHYKNKDSLAAELFSQCLTRFAIYLRERLQVQKSTVGRFRLLVQAFFDFAQQDPASYSYAMFGHYTQFKSLHLNTPMPRDVFVELIQEGMEKGIFQKRDESLAAALVIGAVVRVIFFKQHGLISGDYAELIPQVTEACLRMLSPEDIWGADCC